MIEEELPRWPARTESLEIEVTIPEVSVEVSRWSVACGDFYTEVSLVRSAQSGSMYHRGALFDVPAQRFATKHEAIQSARELLERLARRAAVERAVLPETGAVVTDRGIG